MMMLVLLLPLTAAATHVHPTTVPSSLTTYDPTVAPSTVPTYAPSSAPTMTKVPTTGVNMLGKLTASDGDEGFLFGSAVASDGDVVVVGAPQCDYNGTAAGCAYVYAAPDWTEVAKLYASDAEAYTLFGSAVAVSGDFIAVGAPNATGKVYLYEKMTAGEYSTTYWMEVAKLMQPLDPKDFQPYQDFFGGAVALEGDVLAVASMGYDDPTPYVYDTGAVYVYVKQDDGSWMMTAMLEASDAETSDQLGRSLAMSGNLIAAGAWLADVNSTLDAGAAYVFETEDGGYTWQEVAVLVASDPEASANFGFSIAVSEDVVVVGADDVGANSGAAYVYAKRFGFDEAAKLVSWDNKEGDELGLSVAAEGNLVIVGAEKHGGYWPQQPNASGAAYVWRTPDEGATWDEVAKLTAGDDAAEDDYFGRPIAVAGHLCVVGARLNDDQGPDSGSAYLFSLFA